MKTVIIRNPNSEELAVALLTKAFELKKLRKLAIFGLLVMLLSSTGCGYLFLGTEEIDAWGFKAKFASGVTARAL